MTITNAQYDAWLAADNQRRCVLVEMDVYSGGAAATRYLSTLGFVSTAADTPPNTAYEELVRAVPDFRISMGELLRGRTQISFGEVLIDNSAGVLDAWLNDQVDGRAVRIYLGDPAWPKADFRPVLTGTMLDLRAPDWRTLSLTIRDKQLTLTKPLQTNLIGGTSAQKDLRAPVCYGQVANITPVLIDGATRRYKLHDGQINAISTVYADGVSVGFTADLANGEFTLTAAATGRVTCDAQGSKTGGTYVATTAGIIARILSERAGLAGGEIGSTTALDTDVPGAVGFYAKADDGALIYQALDVLALGAGAYYAVGRDGVVTMGQIKLASGSPVATITMDDIEQRGIEIVRRILPSKSVRLGYARNWTPTYDSGASGLTADQREALGQAYKIAKATNSVPTFLLADDEETADTCFVSGTDAQTEATRRATMWSALRRVIRLRAFVAATRLTLGDVIALDLARYTLAGGVLARVVGFRESIDKRRVTIEVLV